MSQQNITLKILPAIFIFYFKNLTPRPSEMGKYVLTKLVAYGYYPRAWSMITQSPKIELQLQLSNATLIFINNVADMNKTYIFFIESRKYGFGLGWYSCESFLFIQTVDGINLCDLNISSY